MLRQDIQFSAKDTALRDDVHMLGSMVGEMLREQGGDALFEKVEGDRQAAIARRQGDASSAVQLMVRTRERAAPEARDLIRAFSTWFRMVNMAEKVHRIRRRRQYLNDAATPQPGGIEEALLKLKAQGLQLNDVQRLFAGIWIEPVLTAHPTESTRRTILRKQQTTAELLLSRLDLQANANDSQVNLERIRSEITAGWQTAENSRDRLTVADEREHVLFFLAEVIYKVIPIFYEEIEAALEKVFGPATQVMTVPEMIRFGSWVGGDMGSNPDIHAKVIRETIARHHQLIVNSYYLECKELAEMLSQSISRVGVSEELQARIDSYAVLLSMQQHTVSVRLDYMPYRVFLGQIAERLQATYDGRQKRYENAAELLFDAQLIATSLSQHKGKHAGLLAVNRFIRRIRTFGFHLASLDIRQHAEVHRNVVAQGLGDEQWQTYTRMQRIERLRAAINKDAGPTSALDPTGKRTLWVFEAMAYCRHRHGADAIGPYIVSKTLGVDDILSVLLLARWGEGMDRTRGAATIDITPLFETSEALVHCADIMSSLFSEPVYQRHLTDRRNRQFVMLGYSASNKERGALASQWMLYQAQESLVQVARESKVELTIFHGRGSTSIRNSGSVEALVRTMPAGAIRGQARFTEQGEVINEKYSLRPLTLRAFEQAFSALSLSAAGVRSVVTILPAWRQAMEVIAQESARAYHALVYGNAQFYKYFCDVTPIDAIERMQLSSHATGRVEHTTVNDVNAVAWAYAWAQSRHMLPSWYGAGSALIAVSEKCGDAVLQQMYQEWSFFESLIDQLEMGLARADMGIAQYYDELSTSESAGMMTLIRQEFERAHASVLRLKNSAELLDSEPTMQRSIRLRNPYLDPMHLMQVDLLARWRKGGRTDRELLASLLASINGIAQGLQGST